MMLIAFLMCSLIKLRKFSSIPGIYFSSWPSFYKTDFYFMLPVNILHTSKYYFSFFPSLPQHLQLKPLQNLFNNSKQFDNILIIAYYIKLVYGQNFKLKKGKCKDITIIKWRILIFPIHFKII